MVQESKNRILLVEDDADTRFALAMLFEMEGFDVTTAGDGEEAYSQAVSERPDLIVTDINMPNVDGLSLIKMISADGRTAGIPIVAVSAIDKQHLNQAKELGAVAVAQKPIEFDQFLSLIAKVATARSKRNRIERGRRQ
ncbi:MAG: response regulator [Blastocatellia bacterium]